MNRAFHRLAVAATVVALFVIVLGAWVRLSHAGLGCPDWPGCYGHLTWPDAQHELAAANEAFPERPVEAHKAWKEMVHRYLAGALVLLVLALNWKAWRNPPTKRVRTLCAILLGLILFQAALGMWTVTLKLLPIIVMGHLMGGMATLGLLSWIVMESRPAVDRDSSTSLRPQRAALVVALSVLIVQIALGGWTTANYSAIVCPDLPKCQGLWWPDTNFTEGFRLLREVGVDYEGGVLDLPSRTAIHLAHRIGAVITFALLLWVGLRLMRTPGNARQGMVLAGLVSIQFLLGLLNILLALSLPNAVAHNGMAALLLAFLVSLVHRASGPRPS